VGQEDNIRQEISSWVLNPYQEHTLEWIKRLNGVGIFEELQKQK